MHRTKRIILGLCIVSIIFLAGCWDRHEINSIAFVTRMGIDKGDTQPVKVIMEIYSPSGTSGQSQTSGDSENGSSATEYYIKTSEGETLIAALLNAMKETSRRINVTHTDAVIIGEDLCREGITQVSDGLRRFQEFNPKIDIMIAKGSAGDVMASSIPSETLTGRGIKRMLDNSGHLLSVIHSVPLKEFRFYPETHDENLAVPAITVKSTNENGGGGQGAEKSSQNILSLDSLAVFRRDRLVGFLDSDYSKWVQAFQNKFENTIITLPSSTFDTMVTERVLNVKRKLYVEQTTDSDDWSERLKIKAVFFTRNNILEIDKTTAEKFNENTAELLAQETENYIKNEIEETVKRVQTEYQSDILGIGKAVHRQLPDVWNEIENEWDNIFPDVQIEIEVHSVIRRSGMLL